MQSSKLKSKHDEPINSLIKISENEKKSTPNFIFSSNVSHGDDGEKLIHQVKCKETLPASKMTLKHIKSLLSKTKVGLFNSKKRCIYKRNNSLEISTKSFDIDLTKLCQPQSYKTLKYEKRLAEEIPTLCYVKPSVSDVVKYHGYGMCRLENLKSIESIYSFSERIKHKYDSETFIKNFSSKDDSINDNQKAPVFNNQNVLNDLSENTAKYLENECESKSLIQIQNVIKERKIIGNCVVTSNVTTINIKEYQHYGYNIQSAENFNYGDKSGLLYKDRIIDSTKNVLIYVLDSENQSFVDPTLKCLEEEVKHSNQRILEHHVECTSKNEIDKLNKPNQCIAVSFLKEVDCASEKISRQSIDKNKVSKSAINKTNEISSYKDAVIKSMAATNDVTSINTTENSKQSLNRPSDKTSKLDYSPTSRISDLHSDQKYQLITSLINMINDKESDIKLQEQIKDYLEESNIRMSKPITDIVSLIRENASLKNDIKILSDQRISKSIEESPLLLNIEVKEGVSSIHVFKSPQLSVDNQIVEAIDEARNIESVEKVKNLEIEKSSKTIDTRVSNNFSLLGNKTQNGSKVVKIPNVSLSNDFGITNGTQPILEINAPVQVEDIQVDKNSITKSSHDITNHDPIETKPSVLQINELDFELIPSISQDLNSTKSTQTSVESKYKISETEKERPVHDVVIVDIGRTMIQNGAVISKSVSLSVVNGSRNKLSELMIPPNIGQIIGSTQTNPQLLENLITDIIPDEKIQKSTDTIPSLEKKTNLDNILTTVEDKASSSKIPSLSNKIQMSFTDVATTEDDKTSESKKLSLSNKRSIKYPSVNRLTTEANKLSSNKESSLSHKVSPKKKSSDNLPKIEGITLTSITKPSKSSKKSLKENNVSELVTTDENKLSIHQAPTVSNNISLKENTVGDLVAIGENQLSNVDVTFPSNNTSLNKNIVGDLEVIQENKPSIKKESSLFKTTSLKENTTSDLITLEENKPPIDKNPSIVNQISSKENPLIDILTTKANKLPSTKEPSLSSKMSFNIKNSSYQPTIEITSLPNIKESSLSNKLSLQENLPSDQLTKEENKPPSNKQSSVPNKLSLQENTPKDLLITEENTLPTLKESGISIKISFKELSSDERVIGEDNLSQISKELSLTNKISPKENTPETLLVTKGNKQPSISINISFKETSSEERSIVGDNILQINKEPSLTKAISSKEDFQENVLAANNELTSLIEPLLSNITSILSGNKSDDERFSPSNMIQKITSSQSTIEIIQSLPANNITTTENENVDKRIDEISDADKKSLPNKISSSTIQINETVFVQNASQTEGESKTNGSMLPINMTEKTISIQTNVPAQLSPQNMDNVLGEEANKNKSINTDSRDLPSIVRTMATIETIVINSSDLSTLNSDNASVKKPESYATNETDNQTLPYILRTLATTETLTINPVKITEPLISTTQKSDNVFIKETDSYTSNDTNSKDLPTMMRTQGRTDTITMNPKEIIVSVTLPENSHYSTLPVETDKKSVKQIDENTKVIDETQVHKQAELASLKPIEKSNSKTSIQSENGFLKGLKNSLIKRLSSSNKSEKKESIGKESNKSQKEKSSTKKSDSKKSVSKSLEPNNFNNTTEHKQKISNFNKTATSIFESQTEYTPTIHLPDSVPNKSISGKSLKILNNQNSLLTRSVLIHEDWTSDDTIHAVLLKTTSVFEDSDILNNLVIPCENLERDFSIFQAREYEKEVLSKPTIFLSATNVYVRRVLTDELKGDIVNENASLISCVKIGINIVLCHDNRTSQINRISYFIKKTSLTQNNVSKSRVETQLSVCSFLEKNEINKNIKYRSSSSKFPNDRNFIIENEDNFLKMLPGITLRRMNEMSIENEIIFETNPLILESKLNASIRNILSIHKSTIQSDISLKVLTYIIENCEILVNKRLINSFLLAKESLISKTFEQQAQELSNKIEIQKKEKWN